MDTKISGRVKSVFINLAEQQPQTPMAIVTMPMMKTASPTYSAMFLPLVKSEF